MLDLSVASFFFYHVTIIDLFPLVNEIDAKDIIPTLLFIFSNIYQNNNKIGSCFPPTSGQHPSTSGQIPPPSCYSDWLNSDPHMAYKVGTLVVGGPTAQ